MASVFWGQAGFIHGKTSLKEFKLRMSIFFSSMCIIFSNGKFLVEDIFSLVAHKHQF